MRLSEHFDSREFAPRGQLELPSPALRHYRALCRDWLEPLRAEFGQTTVTGGMRTARRNAAVGGAPESYHLRIPGRPGAAADVWCARGSPWDWYAFLDARGCPGLGQYTDHLHVDNRRGRARW